MIQRKQTLFLLLAAITLIVCLCIPIGAFEPSSMGVAQEWFCLGQQTDEGLQLDVIPFVTLTVTVILTLACIFMYKHRKRQAKLCSLAVSLCIIWYLYFGGYIIGAGRAEMHYLLRLGAILPLIAIILIVMARKGILADERLVRSIDRIR